MLVIRRREGETIEIPEIGLTIEVLQTASGQVKLGIAAPRDVKVLRGELLPPKVVTPRIVKKPADRESLVAELAQTYCVSI